MASSNTIPHAAATTPSTAPTNSSVPNSSRLPPLPPTSSGSTNTSGTAPSTNADGSNGNRRPSLFGFLTGRRPSSSTPTNSNSATQPQPTTNAETNTTSTSTTIAPGTGASAAVAAPGTEATTAGEGRSLIAQRRASATAAFSQRRNSALNIALRESRAADERPETNRHQKRPSTTGSDIVEAIRNDIQELSIFDDLSFNMLTPLTLDASGPTSTATVPTTTPAQAAATPSRSNNNASPVAAPTTTNISPPRRNTPTTINNTSTVVAATANTTPAAMAVNATAVNGALNTPSATATRTSTNTNTSTTETTTNRKGREDTQATDANNKAHLDPMRPDIQLTVPSVKQFPQLTKALKSGDKEQELRAVISFRMVLSKSYAAPIQEVVDCGVVPHFVKCLSRDGEDRLQLEASWALTNIASGTTEHTLLVIQAGALPPLLRLIKSNNREIREQAVWGIGNIAGDSPRTRDTVLKEGAVKHLVPQLYLELDRRDNKSMSLLRNMVWATANLCRGKPPPPFEQVRPLLAPLKKVLELNDNEVLADACWALNYLSDTNEHIQEVIQSGVCPRLIQLLGHTEHVVKTPALRAVGNIVTGDNDQTQHMLDLNVIDALKPLLSDPRRTIRGETCWTISNITAGSYTQIQHVMDKDVFPILVNCAMDTESNVAKEAIWAISNATSGGTSEQVVKIASYGCIPALVSALSSFHEMDNRIIMVALEGIENFLVAGDTTENTQNPFISVVRGCGGHDLLKNDLSNHANEGVREKANDIVTKYLSAPEPSAVKPPPEMWTPVEVAEAKKREEELREKYRDQAGMLSDQLNQDRKGKPPRRGSNYIPPQFYCPISQEIMADPVSTVDGHVYDRENIARWFASGNFTSPVTGAKLKSTQLTPNHPLRQMIESFMPGYTHRADLDKEWPCIACTSLNNPVEVKCNVCGAERPPMKNQDPDSIPGIFLAVDKKSLPKNDESKQP